MARVDAREDDDAESSPLMAHVLVVATDPELEALPRDLGQAGHDVRSIPHALDGVATARAFLPDLVILDAKLTDVTALDLTRRLRADPTTRSIAVAIAGAATGEDERIAAYEAGVDDTFVLPMHPRELVLRVRAILRRRLLGGTTELRYGPVRIDKDGHRAWLEDRRLDLTRREFTLLLVLCQRNGGVARREDLLRDLWGSNGNEASRTLDQHVKRLRAKLGPHRARIETVRGLGYRFLDVEAAIVRS